MELRLGQLLIEQGVLNAEQVETILDYQLHSGEPFGLLCERMFHVDPEVIESTWAAQYASLTRTIDPAYEVFEERALELITRRQAWQFRILPIRFDENELMIATTQQHLRRALRFATNVIGIPVYFVIAEPIALGEALCKYYELPGMKPELIVHGAQEGFFGVGDKTTA